MSGDPWFDVLNAAWQANAIKLWVVALDGITATCWIESHDGMHGLLLYRPVGCRWQYRMQGWPEDVRARLLATLDAATGTRKAPRG
jgi:hypothetical protein